MIANCYIGSAWSETAMQWKCYLSQHNRGREWFEALRNSPLLFVASFWDLVGSREQTMMWDRHKRTIFTVSGKTKSTLWIKLNRVEICQILFFCKAESMTWFQSQLLYLIQKNISEHIWSIFLQYSPHGGVSQYLAGIEKLEPGCNYVFPGQGFHAWGPWVTHNQAPGTILVTRPDIVLLYRI